MTSEVLTLQVPVSDELAAETGGLDALLASMVGYVVSTPPYPAAAEAGPWRSEVTFHRLEPGTTVTGPAYAKVEAVWTDVPPERWESLACTWVHMRLRVLAPGEAAEDTHTDPPECGAQDWGWWDDGVQIVLYGTCRKPKGHASRWHVDYGPGGGLLAEWSGRPDDRAPADAPRWEPGP